LKERIRAWSHWGAFRAASRTKKTKGKKTDLRASQQALYSGKRDPKGLALRDPLSLEEKHFIYTVRSMRAEARIHDSLARAIKGP
jgi:hypothetical protein